MIHESSMSGRRGRRSSPSAIPRQRRGRARAREHRRPLPQLRPLPRRGDRERAAPGLPEPRGARNRRRLDGRLVAIASRYSDRLRLFAQDNHGLARTCNRGARAAPGECFLFLSADDGLEQTYVSELLRAVSGEPEASFAYCSARLLCAESGVAPGAPVQRLLLDPRPQLHQRQRAHPARSRLSRGGRLPRGSRRRRVRRLGFLPDHGRARPSRDVCPQAAPPLARHPAEARIRPHEEEPRSRRGGSASDMRRSGSERRACGRWAPTRSIVESALRTGSSASRARNGCSPPASVPRGAFSVRDETPDRRLEAAVGRDEVVCAHDQSSDVRVSCSICSWRAASGSAIGSRRGGTERRSGRGRGRRDVVHLPRLARIEPVAGGRQDRRPHDETDGLGERDEVAAAGGDLDRLARIELRPDLEDVATRLDDVVEARDGAAGERYALGDEFAGAVRRLGCTPCRWRRLRMAALRRMCEDVARAEDADLERAHRVALPVVRGLWRARWKMIPGGSLRSTEPTPLSTRTSTAGLPECLSVAMTSATADEDLRAAGRCCPQRR